MGQSKSKDRLKFTHLWYRIGSREKELQDIIEEFERLPQPSAEQKKLVMKMKLLRIRMFDDFDQGTDYFV